MTHVNIKKPKGKVATQFQLTTTMTKSLLLLTLVAFVSCQLVNLRPLFDITLPDHVYAPSDPLIVKSMNNNSIIYTVPISADEGSVELRRYNYIKKKLIWKVVLVSEREGGVSY